MNDAKAFKTLLAVMVLTLGLGAYVKAGDSGPQDMTRISTGDTIKAKQVAVSSVTATAILSSDGRRPHVILRAHGGDQGIYVSSHSGVSSSNGFLIPSTTTAPGFVLELFGFGGELYGLAEAGANGTRTIGVLEGQVNAQPSR